MDDPELLFACRDMLSEIFRLRVILLGSRDQMSLMICSAIAATCDCDISLFLHPGVSKDLLV